MRVDARDILGTPGYLMLLLQGGELGLLLNAPILQEGGEVRDGGFGLGPFLLQFLDAPFPG